MKDVIPVESGANSAAASTSDASSKLQESAGLFDRMKDKAKSVGHTALGLVHKGTAAAEHSTHSPAAHQAAQAAATIANDATRDEVQHVKRAIAAGKKGDVQGVVENTAPLAKEAALGPHGLLLKKAVQVSKDSNVIKLFPHIHVDHDQGADDASDPRAHK